MKNISNIQFKILIYMKRDLSPFVVDDKMNNNFFVICIKLPYIPQTRNSRARLNPKFKNKIRRMRILNVLKQTTTTILEFLACRVY